MTEMTAAGAFRIGETAAASRVLSRSLLGWRRFGLAIYIVVMAAALLCATAVVDAILPPGLPRRLSFPVVVGAVGVVVFLVYIRWCRSALARAWVRRGVVNPIHTSFQIDADALVITTPSATTRLLWNGVSEIIPSRHHWIFIGNCLGYCLPRRFFETLNEERAFIAAALGLLEPNAVA